MLLILSSEDSKTKTFKIKTNDEIGPIVMVPQILKLKAYSLLMFCKHCKEIKMENREIE